MPTRDKNLRQLTVPFQSQIMGYNHSQNSDQNISMALTNPPMQGIILTDPDFEGLGDLYPLVNATSQTSYMIRFLRPKFGQIVQCYLNIQLTFAASEPNPKFNISVGGSFAGNNITANVPSSTYIAQCMNILNPTGGYFTGTAGQPTTLYGLNIEPLVPQVGSANYIPDFFSVGLHFATPPVQSGTWALTKFFVTGSVLIT